MVVSLGIIGLGKMGEALVGGLSKTASTGEKWKIQATRRTAEGTPELARRLGIKIGRDNHELLKNCRMIILAVKPHQAKNVLEPLSDGFTSEHLLISICASVTIAQMRKWSGGKARIVRCMPNTPCLIGEGMTAISADAGVQKTDIKLVERIFDTVGRTVIVEEHLLDGVTGLSGCGPAYVYLVIEALSEAGVKIGLPRRTATLLAAQTLVGASKMVLQRGEHPAALKDEVTTPAGCTIDGLMALEEGRLRSTLINAVIAATRRSETLSGNH